MCELSARQGDHKSQNTASQCLSLIVVSKFSREFKNRIGIRKQRHQGSLLNSLENFGTALRLKVCEIVTKHQRHPYSASVRIKLSNRNPKNRKIMSLRCRFCVVSMSLSEISKLNDIRHCLCFICLIIRYLIYFQFST